MSEDSQAAEHHGHLGIPAGVIDPHNYDPRKVMDATAMEYVLKAQAAARAQAAASTTVFIGTFVTLISSAFGLVAALAWNTAITKWVNALAAGPLKPLHLDDTARAVAQAVIVTIIAVVAVVVLNRIAGRFAKQNAFKSASD
jgi:ABC-type sulfate transport system permease component